MGDLADPATRQVEVLAWVRNPGELKPGFFAEVTLAVESKKGALTVPEGAVQASERGFIAYAVEDGKARVRPIEIGLRTGTGVVEILSGLKPGEIGGDRGIGPPRRRSGGGRGGGQAGTPEAKPAGAATPARSTP